MPNVERIGDSNIAGGIALVGAPTVFVNGRNVVLPGNVITPHDCCGQSGCNAHCNARAAGGSSSVFADGLNIIHENDFDTCGHKRSNPSEDVIVGA